MTSLIDIDIVQIMMQEAEHDKDGWIKMKSLLDRISLKYECTYLTARNFMLKNIDIFEFKHGYVKNRVEPMSNIEEQVDAQQEFEVWLKTHEAVLNECTEFLSKQTPSPYIENTLVQVAVAREELKSYNSSKYDSLMLDMGRDYNFVPKVNQ